DALDALDALDAPLDIAGILLEHFGNWCLTREGWGWWWELSYVATTHFGALQLGKQLPWTKSILESFVAGAWYLIWTDDRLFWLPKPIVHVERGSFGRRLHCEDGPACANEIENLYFWHGVLVPAYAIVQPDAITIDEIKTESNEEVRRIPIERFGWPRFLTETK